MTGFIRTTNLFVLLSVIAVVGLCWVEPASSFQIVTPRPPLVGRVFVPRERRVRVVPHPEPSLSSSTTVLYSTTSTTSSNSADALCEIRDYTFQGHKIHAEVYSPKNSKNKKGALWHVILIHGFAASTVYWRETVRRLLSQQQQDQDTTYIVHAIDLLGQGKSEKPGRADGVEYSIPLWAQQVEEYARTNCATGGSDVGIVLMGNSLGSVVALMAATGDQQQPSPEASSFLRQNCKGIGMFNCGIGMNSRNLVKEYTGLQKVLLAAIFDAFDALIFGNIPLLTYVLDKVVTKDLLRQTLTGLYQYADVPEDRVDDALVDSFYEPAKDPGSPETLSQIYTNDAGPTPMELYRRHEPLLQSRIPVHLVWGQHDTVTPLEGAVGQFFFAKANAAAANEDNSNNVSMDIVEAGHLPFDEVPASNDLMVQWLNGIAQTKNANNKDYGFKFPFFN